MVELGGCETRIVRLRIPFCEGDLSQIVLEALDKLNFCMWSCCFFWLLFAHNQDWAVGMPNYRI
jgi:hypothetical protein